MHKVFISYHHDLDQEAKDALCDWNNRLSEKVFVDMSVNTGDIDEGLDDETIRVKIRDEYLRDSSVTIVLVGLQTACRKHVDWEIYSSMRDGAVNKKSGILVVLLPSVTEGKSHHVYAPHGQDEKNLYKPTEVWGGIGSRTDFLRDGFEYIPTRIIDSIINKDAKISITTWADFVDNGRASIEKFIEFAHASRMSNEYDLSRPMRERNSTYGN